MLVECRHRSNILAFMYIITKPCAYIVLRSCVLKICLDVAHDAVHITIGAHIHTSEQTCHYKVILVLDTDTILTSCTHTHTHTRARARARTHTHRTMAHSRIPEIIWVSNNHDEALQLFKQTISYYCEERWLAPHMCRPSETQPGSEAMPAQSSHT